MGAKRQLYSRRSRTVSHVDTSYIVQSILMYVSLWTSRRSRKEYDRCHLIVANQL